MRSGSERTGDGERRGGACPRGARCRGRPGCPRSTSDAVRDRPRSPDRVRVSEEGGGAQSQRGLADWRTRGSPPRLAHERGQRLCSRRPRCSGRVCPIEDESDRGRLIDLSGHLGARGRVVETTHHQRSFAAADGTTLECRAPEARTRRSECRLAAQTEREHIAGQRIVAVRVPLLDKRPSPSAAVCPIHRIECARWRTPSSRNQVDDGRFLRGHQQHLEHPSKHSPPRGHQFISFGPFAAPQRPTDPCPASVVWARECQRRIGSVFEHIVTVSCSKS